MEILGFIASMSAGFLLGLMGSGGSIITVPILVYLFKLDIVTATSYSLFIVGVSASTASIAYYKRKLVDVKVFLLFGVPSVVSVFLTRSFLVPILPDEFHLSTSLVVGKQAAIMGIFSLLMLLAAFSLIRKRGKIDEVCEDCQKNYVLPVQGLFVGALTALVGAGGGFIIVPILSLFGGLSMKKAVGTSLTIVSLQSLIGFSTGITSIEIDWLFLLTILVLTISGIGVGTYLSKKIDGKKLKPIFGWFVLLFAVFILIKELV